MPDAIAYIDGFNLYYGSLKGSQNRWFDVQALAQAITPKQFNLTKIRYFTAKVKPNAAKPTAHTDQQAYLDAIGAHCPLVEIHYGHYLSHKVRGLNANPPPKWVEYIKSEEKGSDVNLAVHLVHDACNAGNAAAILITNDSDLAEATVLAGQRNVDVYWFPPIANKGRYPSAELARVIKNQRSIYPSVYGKCLLPDPVLIAAAGKQVQKPAGW